MGMSCNSCFKKCSFSFMLTTLSILVLAKVTTGKFAPGFVFGAATSAYQIEGGWNSDGKGLSNWDHWAHNGHCAGGATGDVADDSYHLFTEDTNLLSQLGVDEYRLSFSWSRMLPNGTVSGGIEMRGIQHYHAVIDSLAARNISVFVTLFHWDLPQILEEERGGWLNSDSAQWFAEYAELCFEHFGKSVKHWATFNEPHEVMWQGFGKATFPPGRCSDRSKCSAGDSATEPYVASHNMLRAHALAARAFRERKQRGSVKGEIGIVLNTDHYEPLDVNSAVDVEACERTYEFQLGMFAVPIFLNGQYPAVMQKLVGSRLPKFTVEESKMLCGSADFLGINHYTTLYCTSSSSSTQYNNNSTLPGWETDKHTSCGYYRNGVPIGERAQSTWLYVVPWGAGKMLQNVAKMLPGVPLFISENGVDVPGESKLPVEQALHDTFRVNYLRDYLASFEAAVDNDPSIQLRGYFVWSLLDNFEWNDAYNMRFGIHYVDFKNGQKRYVKDSAKFYAKFIASHKMSLHQ